MRATRVNETKIELTREDLVNLASSVSGVITKKKALGATRVRFRLIADRSIHNYDNEEDGHEGDVIAEVTFTFAKDTEVE